MQVIDIGAIDHAVGVMSCPMYGILVTAHEEGTRRRCTKASPELQNTPVAGSPNRKMLAPEIKNAAVAGTLNEKWLQLCSLALFIFLPSLPSPALVAINDGMDGNPLPSVMATGRHQ